MTKHAIIYDKWLHSLGGGEVVACSIAKILLKIGYKVTIISGKTVSPSQIKDVLGIDLRRAEFLVIWNDEASIHKIARDKDLFINTSFMDYTRGVAKQNIYYTHFPTESYMTLRGKIFNELLLPLAAKYIKPFEFIEGQNPEQLINGHHAYLLGAKTKLAFAHLTQNSTHQLKLTIFLSRFTKVALDNIDWSISSCKILERHVEVDHFHNCIHLKATVVATTSTIYVSIFLAKSIVTNYLPQQYYLVNHYLIPKRISKYFVRLIEQKINLRLRAGIFSNIRARLASYQTVLANSEFTAKWISKYWNISSQLLYPPVQILKVIPPGLKKSKQILSVGRFFTLGHGKKQEVLIAAFKQLYDLGYHDWELHLAGGFSDDTSSRDFVNLLQREAVGYPIHFHFNISKTDLDNLIYHSRIYWHATGYGESKTLKPIKFEHFGISVVEAISAGLIPILYNGGGLPEIIHKLALPDKLLFNTISELVTTTNQVINDLDNEIYKDLNLKSSIFSTANFEKNFIALVGKK